MMEPMALFIMLLQEWLIEWYYPPGDGHFILYLDQQGNQACIYIDDESYPRYKDMLIASGLL